MVQVLVRDPRSSHSRPAAGVRVPTRCGRAGRGSACRARGRQTASSRFFSGVRKTAPWSPQLPASTMRVPTSGLYPPRPMGPTLYSQKDPISDDQATEREERRAAARATAHSAAEHLSGRAMRLDHPLRIRVPRRRLSRAAMKVPAGADRTSWEGCPPPIVRTSRQNRSDGRSALCPIEGRVSGPCEDASRACHPVPGLRPQRPAPRPKLQFLFLGEYRIPEGQQSRHKNNLRLHLHTS